MTETTSTSGAAEGAEPGPVAPATAELPGGVAAAVEAVLMVVDEPVGDVALAAALEVPLEEVRNALERLSREFAEQQRGFMVRQVGDGWRFFSRSEFAPIVERFLLDGQQARLTQAALETLAVIAYRQPVSRARIGAVRGVSVDSVVRTLVGRGLVAEVEEQGEAGSALYGTTPYFLQRLGLSSLDDLPALAPYMPEVDVLDEIAETGRA